METDNVTRLHLAEPSRRGAEPAGIARRLGALLAGSAAALALVYGTRIALSLTAVVGRRAELLLSIQPGPFTAGGGVLALVLACGACRARRPRR